MKKAESETSWTETAQANLISGRKVPLAEAVSIATSTANKTLSTEVDAGRGGFID
jgi:hypothetical protein